MSDSATTILTLVGSLRAGSTNRKLAELATEVAPAGTAVEIYEGLRDIPFYDEDLDNDTPPPAAVALREAAAAADGLLLVTPMYNGGVPAHLKNAIDWLSRPNGEAAIADKPVAAIGTAWGQDGGSFAHDSLRTSAKIAGGVPVEEAKLSIPGSLGRFSDQHPREDAEVREQVAAAVAQLVAAVPAIV